MFQADLLQMFQEVQRQKSQDPFHQLESENGKDLFFFFMEDVLPLIKSDPWVFEAAERFALEFAEEYFIMLRLLKVEEAQEKLERIKGEVTEFIKLSVSPQFTSKDIKLVKPSDFNNIIEPSKLSDEMQRKAEQLYFRALDLEYLYVHTISQAVQTLYEKGFPRVFYVVNRALKVQRNSKRKPKFDNHLRDPHDYLNWCEQQLEKNHILHKLFVSQRNFYKITRNVASHKFGPKWLSQSNQVHLPDRDNPNTIENIDKFAERYRYLMYFCEIGTRGVLAIFCDRDRGAASNHIKDKYMKIYNNPELHMRLCNYSI